MGKVSHLTTTQDKKCPCKEGSKYCHCCQNEKVDINVYKDCPCQCGRLAKDCCVALVNV